MFDRVLLPVAGPPHADRAVELAVDIGHRHDADVHVLHVLQSERVVSMPIEAGWSGVTPLLREDGEAMIDQVADHLDRAGIDHGSTIKHGTPVREIIDTAETEGCDLIVMATTGRIGIDRILFGSVTERVVRRSPVPVLTIRADPEVSTVETANADVTG